MLMSADKVGGWGQKGQKHADVILEWSDRKQKYFTGHQNFKRYYQNPLTW